MAHEGLVFRGHDQVEPRLPPELYVEPVARTEPVRGEPAALGEDDRDRDDRGPNAVGRLSIGRPPGERPAEQDTNREAERGQPGDQRAQSSCLGAAVRASPVLGVPVGSIKRRWVSCSA